MLGGRYNPMGVFTPVYPILSIWLNFFDPPLLRKTFWSPPSGYSKLFWPPSILPSPPTKVFMNAPLKVSDEEKFLLFQYSEINSKSAMLSYWYAWCKNADNIDPNWAIEVCKMKCNDNHLFISIQLEIKRIGLRKKISMRWSVVQIIHHNVEPISKVNRIYCNNGNGYFSPLRCHRMINTWSISTNEVSKLLWFNFLLHAVITFEQ